MDLNVARVLAIRLIFIEKLLNLLMSALMIHVHDVSFFRANPRDRIERLRKLEMRRVPRDPEPIDDQLPSSLQQRKRLFGNLTAICDVGERSDPKAMDALAPVHNGHRNDFDPAKFKSAIQQVHTDAILRIAKARKRPLKPRKGCAARKNFNVMRLRERKKIRETIDVVRVRMREQHAVDMANVPANKLRPEVGTTINNNIDVGRKTQKGGAARPLIIWIRRRARPAIAPRHRNAKARSRPEDLKSCSGHTTF